MKKDKITLFSDERAAIHAKLGSILKGGDPAEILLVVILLLALRPAAQSLKKERAAKTAALRTSTRTGRASQAPTV